ncbi:hypothetical protein RFI_18917 [Reticulomyxa filosa]|uniref:Uncharacterized protein n=1 Tax=Reticulomyxa filosa TaxID=46433 RepID=X6MXZ8_RETFI|nr:hypothetical protein RFI_18917 [Reticulomyxa filosa]|eukprot:ETO18357.1 hypothetical protein RFI_18917 [Reticulomyxa filosa]
MIYLLFFYSPQTTKAVPLAVGSPTETKKETIPDPIQTEAPYDKIKQLPFSTVSIDNNRLSRIMPHPVGVYLPTLLFEVYTRKREDCKKHKPGQNIETSANTIFITFPSLNDPDCNETVISAFGNASNPDNLFFGIYEQNTADSHLDCLDISGVNCPFHPICTRLWQVRIERVSVAKAAGPIWGRYKADQLYKGEKFLLITDSHTFFRPYWDEIALNLWHKLENEYGILTHYPKPETSMNDDLAAWTRPDPEKPMSYHICGSIFEGGSNYLPRNANGCYTHVIPKLRDAHRSVLVPFWAAGFSFSKAHLREQVPWDPYCKFVFHGEEFLFVSKAWTHGYDMYSPPYDIVFHRYYEDASKTPRFNINHINAERVTKTTKQKQ